MKIYYAKTEIASFWILPKLGIVVNSHKQPSIQLGWLWWTTEIIFT